MLRSSTKILFTSIKMRRASKKNLDRFNEDAQKFNEDPFKISKELVQVQQSYLEVQGRCVELQSSTFLLVFYKIRPKTRTSYRKTGTL